MMLKETISQIETKIDSTYLTRMVRVSLFGDHLAAYAEYVKYLQIMNNLVHLFIDTNWKT